MGKNINEDISLHITIPRNKYVALQEWKNKGMSVGSLEQAILDGTPVKTGHWIHRCDDTNDWLECSECEHGSEGEIKLNYETPYCPMCGTKMEGVRWK